MDTNLNAVDLAAMPSYEYAGIAAAHYRQLHQELEELTAKLERAQSVIGVITAGLPENIRVKTTTQYMVIGDRRPTRVFRLQKGEWREWGIIVTEGGHCEFYGTGGFVTADSEVVITDHQSGFGISVGDDLEFIDLSNDPNRRTLGGPSLVRHANTLSMLQDTQPGDLTCFDCMWP